MVTQMSYFHKIPVQRSQMNQLSVIGGGGFGTALACVAARAGRQVRLWVRNPGILVAINKGHRNPAYLPGLALPETILATADLALAGDADAILLAVPAQFMREVLVLLAPHLRPGAPLLICAKGIETGTNMLMHQVAGEITPGHPVAVLSGPSFAADIANRTAYGGDIGLCGCWRSAQHWCRP